MLGEAAGHVRNLPTLCVLWRQDSVLFCARFCDKHFGKHNLIIHARAQFDFEVGRSLDGDSGLPVVFENRTTQDSACARNAKFTDT